MKMTMLDGYLFDWMAWVQSGAPNRKPYNRGLGLCGNVKYYVANYVLPLSVVEDAEERIKNEMQLRFNIQGLDYAYPFGVWAYDERMMCGSQHEDPNRLAWVQSELTKAEEKYT